MKKYFVNFATPEFYGSQERLNKTAEGYGFKAFSYTMEGIKGTNFYKRNKALLSEKKGAGYWSWKPYIVLDVMKRMKEGDLLVYCDSGLKLIGDPSDFAKLCKRNKGILLFANESYSKHYTKRDCYILMGCDSEKYWRAHQANGGLQVYIKNAHSQKVLKEWLKYVQVPGIVNDSFNKCGKPNLSGFIQHSWDQSVLSNLAVKHGIKLYRRLDDDKPNPEFPDCNYPMYFIAERKKKRSLGENVVLKFKMILPLSVKHAFKRTVNGSPFLHGLYYKKNEINR